MIERLGPQRGAWNDDTARLIEKVNELVDLANSKEIGSELQKKAPTATHQKASPKDIALERKAKVRSPSKGKAAAAQKNDQNFNF